MDSGRSWLDSVPQGGSASPQALAPPPVSFGSNSSAELPNVDLRHHVFASASADNIVDNSLHGDTQWAENDPDSIPLSLTAQDLTLEESKTYMRWYLDILARTNQRTVSIADVYQFLSNFRLSAATKEQVNRVFLKILTLINIGEFFALLRVVSHTLNGQTPSRALIRVQAPVPVPPLILSKKRQNDDADDGFDEPPDAAQPAPPLDLDLFTQFMLTGERPDETRKKRLKKLKSVTFSDQIVTDVHDASPERDQPLDYLLPMDQLLSRMQHRPPGPEPSTDAARPTPSPDPEESQILRDMAGQINHFRNLHSVDTMLVGGVPANIHLHAGLDFLLPRLALPQLLQPNMTGPAQMARYFGQSNTDGAETAYGDAADTGNGAAPYNQGGSPLRPNVTGPADMARQAVSLQLFTAQMTGDTAANTSTNARIGSDAPPVPATRRVRLHSVPSPHIDWGMAAQPRAENGGDLESRPGSATQGNGANFPEVRVSSDSQANLSTASHSSGNAGNLSPGPGNFSAGNFGPGEFLGGLGPATHLAPPRLRSALASPPPVPPRSPLGRAPPPPPPRRLVVSPPNMQSLDAAVNAPPPLPAKVPHPMYENPDGSSSTANILDDLKALQAEVDRIRAQTGGF